MALTTAASIHARRPARHGQVAVSKAATKPGIKNSPKEYLVSPINQAITDAAQSRSSGCASLCVAPVLSTISNRRTASSAPVSSVMTSTALITSTLLVMASATAYAAPASGQPGVGSRGDGSAACQAKGEPGQPDEGEHQVHDRGQPAADQARPGQQIPGRNEKRVHGRVKGLVSDCTAKLAWRQVGERMVHLPAIGSMVRFVGVEGNGGRVRSCWPGN